MIRAITLVTLFPVRWTQIPLQHVHKPTELAFAFICVTRILNTQLANLVGLQHFVAYISTFYCTAQVNTLGRVNFLIFSNSCRVVESVIPITILSRSTESIHLSQ